jgi:lysozyme family protein
MTDVATALADPRFTACWPFTLIQECPLPNDWSNRRNFSNDAHDPGGETMCGIIQREYDHYRRSKGLPLQDVSKISRDEGADIYYNSYWSPDCPKLSPGLDLQFFDESVNAGPGAATLILQRSLQITADRAWGPQTDATVKAIANPAAIIKAFTAEREAYYRALSGFKYFGTDWIRRSVEIGADALKMATTPTATS